MTTDSRSWTGNRAPRGGRAADAPPADSPPPTATVNQDMYGKSLILTGIFFAVAVTIISRIFDTFQIISAPHPAHSPLYVHRQAINPQKHQELSQYRFIMYACTSFFFNYA